MRSSAPVPFGLIITVSRCGTSQIGDIASGFCFSQSLLIRGLAVEAEVGLVYDPSIELPICGEGTPYSAGLYARSGRRFDVLLVLVVLMGVSSWEENRAAFGEVE